MAETTGLELGPRKETYLHRTWAHIETLRKKPTKHFDCAHQCPDAAVAIFEVEGGCVGLSQEIQCLCWQHAASLPDGGLGPTSFIVDLSINGQLSEHYGAKPCFVILQDPQSGEIALVNVADNKA